MKEAIVTLTGTNNMIHSRAHMTPKLPKEKADDYEDRTWKEKLHADKDVGVVLIPGDAVKKSLDSAVKRLGEKTKGKATYTKHFKSGARTSALYYPTSVSLDSVTKLSIFCETSAGSGTRVMRHFPLIPSGWIATVDFIITDDIIDQDVFMRSLTEAGRLVGIGSFRVENGGRCGTFNVELKSWREI